MLIGPIVPNPGNCWIHSKSHAFFRPVTAPEISSPNRTTPRRLSLIQGSIHDTTPPAAGRRVSEVQKALRHGRQSILYSLRPRLSNTARRPSKPHSMSIAFLSAPVFAAALGSGTYAPNTLPVAVRQAQKLSWSAADWIEGPGACLNERNGTVRGAMSLSVSDWQEGAGSCFAETWRDAYPRADLDASSSGTPDSPTLPTLTRSPSALKKPSRRPAHPIPKKKSQVISTKAKASAHTADTPPAPLTSPEPASPTQPSQDTDLTLHYDFVIIGSGVAGLRYALAVAEEGSVAVVTKSHSQESSTRYAQGGVSAVLDPLDSVENHIRDTIVAGAYLCDEEAVEVVCREGPDRVRELMAMGASFDRGEDGQLHLAREGGHSHSRIVHAADVTGREIERALLTAVQKNPKIRLFEHHFAVDLLTSQEGEVVSCHGVDALNLRSGKMVRFLSGSLLLASGGAGHVYPNTTNPTVATGDGVALAQRAGAAVSNMEFVQFHPTSLADAGLPLKPSVPRANAFLITEAVRGAGGVLYNQAGERFMGEYDPRGELAPRDVVARSIDDQLKRRGEKFVWLDLSHQPEAEILHHFPNIAAECLKCGLDMTKQPIPVVPAAHYMCGGVQTGLYGETSIVGLFAAGEVACTGLHGANRLASNSLLEALVFAQRAVGPAIKHAAQAAKLKGGRRAEDWGRSTGAEVVGEQAEVVRKVTAHCRESLQELMWEYVGIVRSTERLMIANLQLASLAASWQEELAAAGLKPTSVTREICEMRNLLSVASLIVRSALQRHESRGLHYVTDFPQLVESQRLPTVLLGEPSNVAGRAQLL